jgi:peptide/nickel transport system permease protein
MGTYIIRRVLLIVPTLFFVSLVTFILMRIIPGDVVSILYQDSSLSPQQIADVRHQLGMDQPAHVQYLEWIGGILRFDAGLSLWTKRPVLQEIALRLPVTLELALLAFVGQLVIAIPLGVLAATNQDKPQDQIARLLAIVTAATPDFWIATMALVTLVSVFGWIPPLGGITPFLEDPLHNLQQFVLPALILSLTGAASLTRYMRNQLLEVIRQDYIRTAFAKGLTRRRVWYGHALRNAMMPVVTQAGSQLGFLLGGAVIIENIFSLPGVAQLTLSAIQHRDITQLEINVLFIAVVFVTVNLLVDLSYAWLDPRIRFS